MTYVRPRPLPWVLLAYALGGLTIAAALPWLKGLAGRSFGRSGLAVAFVVNVAMPGLVVTLAALYPRFSTALLGTLVATAAFLAVSGFPSPPLNDLWLRNVIGQMGPILTVAAVAFHLLAAATVALTRTVRRVGMPPDPAACAGCGYLLVGLVSQVCPECGQAREAAQRG